MYIPVRDETNYMIKYYQYLFNKYWGDHVKVYFLGYKKPDIKLEKNINFISLAEQRAPEAHAWSAPIVDFFESIDDEYFYFSVEDLLIIRPVDLELLKTCRKIMSPKIGRIDLWNSCQFDPGRRGWVEYYKEVDKQIKDCPNCFKSHGILTYDEKYINKDYNNIFVPVKNLLGLFKTYVYTKTYFDPAPRIIQECKWLGKEVIYLRDKNIQDGGPVYFKRPVPTEEMYKDNINILVKLIKSL